MIAVDLGAPSSQGLPMPPHSPSAFPFPDPPARGQAVEVASGVLWLRLPLPFRLDHVNVYLVEDGAGWLLIDTGAGDAPTVALWAELLEGDADGPLQGRPITRILVTHHHPDHVGAAAFLAARTGAELLMGETEYLIALNATSGNAADAVATRLAFYRRNGVAAPQLDAAQGHVARYRELVPGLPSTFRPLRPGDRVHAGSRELTVIEAAGHAPAQTMLHATADNLLFVADHVLTRISPNIGVADRAPDDDSLGRYLTSLALLRDTVPDGGLVLPGHHIPFRHLHGRIVELETHHAERCAAIETACEAKGLTAAELVPILFPFTLDPHEFWFAFSEVLAHLNHLGGSGRLERRSSHGRQRWGQPARASHGQT